MRRRLLLSNNVSVLSSVYWKLVNSDTGAVLNSSNYVKAADGTISGTLTETAGDADASGIWAVSQDETGVRFTNLNTGLLLTEENSVATLSETGSLFTVSTSRYIEVGSVRYKMQTVDTISKTISSAGYTTAHYPFAVRLADGLTANVCVYNDEESKVAFTNLNVSELPAYTPIVLEGNAGTYTLTLLPEGVDTLNVENDLIGTLCRETISNSVTAYVLAYVDGEVGFYVIESGDDADRTVNANNAYITRKNYSDDYDESYN